VDTAEDGEFGWEALQAKNYDLLITDNNMPKVSGLELVKKLRSARMALPVILASGAMPEELNRLP
jgi:YesN/AraC family two-component response regulator